jgi:hypothetical protein
VVTLINGPRNGRLKSAPEPRSRVGLLEAVKSPGQLSPTMGELQYHRLGEYTRNIARAPGPHSAAWACKETCLAALEGVRPLTDQSNLHLSCSTMVLQHLVLQSKRLYTDRRGEARSGS